MCRDRFAVAGVIGICGRCWVLRVAHSLSLVRFSRADCRAGGVRRWLHRFCQLVLVARRAVEVSWMDVSAGSVPWAWR